MSWGVPIGGGRSGGNNFFAEIVGVTFAAMIIPDVLCELISDSKSVIDCLSQGKLSDRQRARLPCRGWMGRLSKMLARKPLCKVIHVHSHTGAGDALSVGNDAADLLAKEARVRGPLVADYTPTLDAGGVYLTFRSRVLMGGVKKDVQCVMKFLRLLGRSKLRAQNETLRSFPTVFRAAHKQVKALAGQEGNPKIWSSFVLNSLRWSCAPRVKGARPLCSLCHLQVPDDMAHWGFCPALSSFHNQLNFILVESLARLGVHIPRIEDPLLWGIRFLLSSPEVVLGRDTWGIADRHLLVLARRYVLTLRGQDPSPSKFVSQISRLLARVACSCGVRHVCNLRNTWSTPVSLVKILRFHFELQVEGCADPLHLTDVLPRYFSPVQEDNFFGAEYDVLSSSLLGAITFLNPPFSGKVEWEGRRVHVITALLRRWAGWCQGVTPTRGVFVIPEPDFVGGREFIEEAEALGGFTFFSSSFSAFGFGSPDAYRHNQAVPPGPYSGRVHLVLFQNAAAAAAYPFSPSKLLGELKLWIDKEGMQAELFMIPDLPLFPLPPPKRVQSVGPTHYAISMFPSVPTPCPKQLKEVLVPKEVKDFLLSLPRQNFIPLLAGFLPSPFHHFIKKRCSEYKREIEMIRIELLVVVSCMVSFKLAVSNHTSQTLETVAASGDSSGLFVLKTKKKQKNVNNLLGSSGDKDLNHCDRLKRFKP